MRHVKNEYITMSSMNFMKAISSIESIDEAQELRLNLIDLFQIIKTKKLSADDRLLEFSEEAKRNGGKVVEYGKRITTKHFSSAAGQSLQILNMRTGMLNSHIRKLKDIENTKISDKRLWAVVRRNVDEETFLKIQEEMRLLND